MSGCKNCEELNKRIDHLRGIKFHPDMQSWEDLTTERNALKKQNEELKKQDEEYRIKIHDAFDYQDDLEQQLKSLRERAGNIPQLLHIFQDYTREDMKGVYYYIHDKDFMKLIQKLSEYIRGE